jgi:ABC-type multidrug transport system ATPase subunit
MSVVLEVEHISRSFGRQQVLTDVSLSVSAGQMVGITGENGSGKSTLLQIVTGMLKADGGKVTLPVAMGYCPQEILLFEQLTVLEHFKCWAVGYGLQEPLWKERMEMLLQQFRFAQHLQKRVAHLSGGTKQKLNLSLSLLHHPDLLVLDEPYAGFDWETYLCFWEYAEQVVKAGRSILVVSHFISDQQRFHRVLNLQNGVLT